MQPLNHLTEIYAATINALGGLAVLMLVQVIIADITGLRARHVPGTPVTPDHNNLLFRASRTVANTNESVAIFILLAAFCMFSGASPEYTGWAAWAYVAARAAYATCYYTNLQVLRSVTFAISLVLLAVMAGLGIRA